MKLDPKKIGVSALLLVGLALVYWQVFSKLIYDWGHDDNYSHGFLIIPIALYFVWERRERLLSLEVRPTWFGLVVFTGGILVLLAGLLGAELFLSRISLIGVLGGMILFLFGWAHLRALVFPLSFLLLMIPLPAIIFNQIAFPLQLLASRAGEFAISSANIPVLREGNVLVLANTTLEVAEACSGIRSLISLLALGIVFGSTCSRVTEATAFEAVAGYTVAIDLSLPKKDLYRPPIEWSTRCRTTICISAFCKFCFRTHASFIRDAISVTWRSRVG